MARILLTLTVISAVLYCLLAVVSWTRQFRKRGKASIAAPFPAYFWGFTFAVFFYYGFPIWWWRYGLRNAIKLVLSCIFLVAATQAILRLTGMIEVNGFAESVGASLFISVPIRALAGFWVARNDWRWRSAILVERKARINAAAPR